MPVSALTHPTLVDLVKRSDPDGKIAKIAEILTETNGILEDAVFVEGNLPTGHRTTVRTGIPIPTWRKLYGGVQPTKSQTAQVTDNTGMLEAYAEVDKALADLNNNTAEFRLSEDTPFIEGMNQEMANTLFYGNEGTQPEAFTGLAPRYSTIQSSAAENAENVIDGGGTSVTNRSIWLVVWGPNTIHGIIPKGSSGGLIFEDKGQVTIENADGNGGRMEAYRSHYRWDAGLTVRDWRYAVRICNVDRTTLTKDAATGADLSDLMFQAMDRIPNLSLGRAVWYMDRNTLTFLRRQTSQAVKNSTLSYENVGGRMITAFHEVPIKRCDALNGDEAQVT